MREVETLVHYWDCKTMQLLWRTIKKFHKKIRNRNTIQSSNPTSEYISKGNENGTRERAAVQHDSSVKDNSQEAKATSGVNA